jgi:hypothetical protein
VVKVQSDTRDGKDKDAEPESKDGFQEVASNLAAIYGRLIPESTIGKTAAGITGALALGPRYSKELLKENLKNMSPGKAFVRSLTPGAAYRVGAFLLFVF